ncbi:hypothetical protein ACWGF3_07205, partial [Streptomyces xanthophaeus]
RSRRLGSRLMRERTRTDELSELPGFREPSELPWLDAQDPKALEWMRTLDVGEAPKDGWTKFLTAGPPAKPAAPATSAEVTQAGEPADEGADED